MNQVDGRMPEDIVSPAVRVNRFKTNTMEKLTLIKMICDRELRTAHIKFKLVTNWGNNRISENPFKTPVYITLERESSLK